jgi:hypothetical protein
MRTQGERFGGGTYTERFLSSLMALISIFLRPIAAARRCDGRKLGSVKGSTMREDVVPSEIRVALKVGAKRANACDRFEAGGDCGGDGG